MGKYVMDSCSGGMTNVNYGNVRHTTSAKASSIVKLWGDIENIKMNELLLR